MMAVSHQVDGWRLMTRAAITSPLWIRPAISPEGDWVAYTLRTHDVEEDRRNTDLYMVRWDGSPAAL